MSDEQGGWFIGTDERVAGPWDAGWRTARDGAIVAERAERSAESAAAEPERSDSATGEEQPGDGGVTAMNVLEQAREVVSVAQADAAKARRMAEQTADGLRVHPSPTREMIAARDRWRDEVEAAELRLDWPPERGDPPRELVRA